MEPGPQFTHPYAAPLGRAKDARDPSEGSPPGGTSETHGAREKEEPDGQERHRDWPGGRRRAPVATDEVLDEDDDELDEGDDELDDADDEGSDEGDPALSPADWTLIKALARGRTHQEAAALIGRAAKFVQRRLNDPVFAGALKGQQATYQEQLQGLFDDGAIEALRALKRLAHSERDADSIRACDVILGRGLQLRSLQARQDLDRRVAEIESALAVEEALEDEARGSGRR